MANLLDYVGLGHFLEKIKTLFVTALGTSGNNLTWTKNGTTNNITIPYATKAGKLSVTSTDNAVVRFDGTSGAVQNSGVTINDSSQVTAARFITSGGTASLVVLGNGSLAAAKELPQYEAYLEWGGKNFSGNYGPIDAAMVAELGACRTMFSKAAGLLIEYSTDSGTTWINYGASDSAKVALFSVGNSFYTGANITAGGGSPNNMLRVTLRTSAAGIYTTLNKFVIFVGSNGSTGCYCTIRCRTLQNYEDDIDTWVTLADLIPILGWTGYNVINISPTTTYGNTKNTQYGEWQFIFGSTGFSGSSTGLYINKIFGFGGMGWVTPSNMAKTGHLYSYDSLQNTTFPAQVTATAFKKVNGTSSQFLKADGSVDSTSYGTYSKPSGGIPKTDLASAVLTSLGKADTALLSFTETDPTVPSWAKQSSKPTYTALEVGALPSTTSIPSKTSDLTNDSGFITSSDISGVYKYKGTKTNYSNLPTSGNVTGDVWNVTNANGNIPAGTNYAWNGSAWDALGGSVDLSGYVPTSRTINGKALTSNITLSASDVSALPSSTTIPTALSDLTDDTTHRLVTDTEKTNWNNKTSNVGTITSVVTTAGAHTTINATSGSAAFNIPTKTSHLTNDSGFLTSHLNIKTVNSNTLVGTGNVTIPTPNDATLTIKRDGLSLGTFTSDSSLNKDIELSVLLTKSYTGVIGTANNNPGAVFYFMSVLPNDWNTPCKVTYRIRAEMAGLAAGKAFSVMSIVFSRATAPSYDVWNYIGHTDYRPYYYHYRYLATSTGFSNNYGHLMGIGLNSSYSPTTATYARNFTVEILETLDCTVTLFDDMTKYASVPGTGSTNYSGETTYNATTLGETHSGDANDVNYYNREYYGSRKTNSALYRYMLCLTKSDGSLVPMNSVSNVTAKTKTLTTDSFDPFGEIFFWNTTTTYTAGANVGDGSWYRQYICDLRYSFNCGGYNVDGGGTLTARLPLYLVAVPQTDGTAVLHSEPLSQTLPNLEDGLIYIYLGRVYQDSYPYRLLLSLNHPIYYYKDSAVRLWTGRSYLTSETDPVFSASPAANITSSNITDWNNKESTSNKVTSISASSTDNLYPSAKCVHDLVSGISNYIFIEGNNSYNDY